MNDSRPSAGLVEARIEERFPSERFPEVVALYLYGSEARGSAHVDSDVDVAVLVDREVTFLVERLAELRRHIDHLRELRGGVSSTADLERDVSLHNDVLFSLLMVAQLVIDVCGEAV